MNSNLSFSLFFFRLDYDYKISYNNGNGNVTIDFNICDETKRKCPDGAKDYANIINENNTCNHMSTKSISDIDVQLIDTAVPDLGLQLYFKDGDKCNATSNWGLLV